MSSDASPVGELRPVPPSLPKLLEQLQAVVVALDEHGRVVWLNRSSLGLEVGELLSGCLHELPSEAAPNSEGATSRRFQTKPSGALASVAIAAQTLDHPDAGAAEWLLLTRLGAPASASPGLEMADGLRQLQKLERLSLLAPSVAHEVSNSIQGIMNYAELIRETSGSGSGAASFASEIYAEIERLSSTVRALLEMTSPDPAKVKSEQLADIVGSVQCLMQSALMREQISLAVELSPDVATLKCSGQQVRQLLLNLLCQARDSLNVAFEGYHPEKKIVISSERFVEAGAAWLRLKVRDFGKGMSVDRQLAAERPPRLPWSDDERRVQSSWVSAAIADAHGGRLVVVPAEPGLLALFELPVSGAA